MLAVAVGVACHVLVAARMAAVAVDLGQDVAFAQRRNPCLHMDAVSVDAAGRIRSLTALVAFEEHSRRLLP